MRRRLGRRGAFGGRFDLRRYVRARLHRRLFLAMGIAIFVSLVLSILVSIWINPNHPGLDMSEAEQLVSAQFARHFADETARDELADQISRAFSVALLIEDDEGRILSEHGGRCQRPDFVVDVRAHSGDRLGKVGVCGPRAGRFRAPWLIALLTFGFFLWVSSGIIAHHLGRPLGKLVDVTREIGAGRLSSRARLGRHETGELGVLAESINDMAARIEKQMDDQKELLAAVSHEMRTPLARLRIISELLENDGASAKLTKEMEREILDLDDLIGQLLASSQLEFKAMRSESHDALDIARLALVRGGLDPQLLKRVDGAAPRVIGDATLLSRALLNLINNARVHGGGVTSVTVSESRGGRVEFSVEDGGSGFSSSDLSKAFESFYRGQGADKSAGTLGLGLSLVRRIALAHGGDARAENLPNGGARVSFWINPST